MTNQTRPPCFSWHPRSPEMQQYRPTCRAHSGGDCVGCFAVKILEETPPEPPKVSHICKHDYQFLEMTQGLTKRKAKTLAKTDKSTLGTAGALSIHVASNGLAQRGANNETHSK